MATDLVETDFSAQSLTPNVRTLLTKALDPEAIFTNDDIRAIEPIARAVPMIVAADDKMLRQSLGALSSALPAQATDELSGKLKLNAYVTMLRGVSRDAMAYACRRALDECDWFPTIKAIKAMIADYVSPEQRAITAAQCIVRRGATKATPEHRAPTDEDYAKAAKSDLGRQILGVALRNGFVDKGRHDRAMSSALASTPETDTMQPMEEGQ